METALRVVGLSKTYGEGEMAVRALESVDLTVAAGELVALLGPSGSGKSTLLLCISLILEPTEGEIEMMGEPIYRAGRTLVDVRRFRRHNIGFIFQQHNLIPFLSAGENVALVYELAGSSGRAAHRKALELLAELGVGHRGHDLPANLSGGEQQRVAIARALASSPRLVLADEPTAALDTERGTQVMALLRRITRERGAAVVTVTHDVRMISGFDSVYRIRDGHLVPAERAPGVLASTPGMRGGVRDECTSVRVVDCGDRTSRVLPE